MSKYLFSVASVLLLLQSCTTQPSSPVVITNGISSHVLASNSVERSYQVYRPESATEGAPAIFVLHGSGGSGSEMRAIAGAGFERLADQHGFLVVYPDGFENHWNDCRGSASYSANTENVDDTRFFQELTTEVAKRQQASTDKMFLTGLSNGGQMAYKMAFESPRTFKAYAAVIASLPEESNLDCDKSNTAVSMMIMNGDKDPINPYNGGVVSIGYNTSRGAVLSTRETALYWAGLAGNRRPPSVKLYPERDGDDATSIEAKTWQKDNGHQIKLVTMKGSGHVFPSINSKIPTEYASLLGKAAGDVDGADLVVEFFLGRL
ncbi:MAG: PHB depolymerase family esterase [Pseudomonadales bacterium]